MKVTMRETSTISQNSPSTAGLMTTQVLECSFQVFYSLLDLNRLYIFLEGCLSFICVMMLNNDFLAGHLPVGCNKIQQTRSHVAVSDAIYLQCGFIKAYAYV